MQEKTKPKRWTAWLIYAVIVLALISTTTLSRYISTVSGSGMATVAAVDMEGNSVSSFTVGNMLPGSSREITFNVVNFSVSKVSDVSQNYTITINASGDLPLTYELQCTNIGNSGTGIYLNNFTALTSEVPSAVGILPHTTATTHQYSLRVTWPNTATDPSLAGKTNSVNLVVNSQQITPGSS